MLKPADFFRIEQYAHSDALFKNAPFVWDALKPDRLQKYLSEYLEANAGIYGEVMSGVVIEDESLIYIGEGTVVESGVYIKGPAIIGRGCEIRHGAYIRENIITGDNCVIGHATEVKNSIFLDGCNAPHFNYVGDSILGNDVNLGAGTKLSNLSVTSGVQTDKHLRPSIKIKLPDNNIIDTDLPKMGAILGDSVETGCNVVTNPGCLVGKGTLIYPNSSIRGYYHPQMIVKWKPKLERVKRK